MIKINCQCEETIKLSDLVPFQGKLKKRTDQDLTTLAQSLTQEGLMAPFFVWKNNEKSYVLDGHGRLEALMRLSMLMPDVLTQDFPCVYIEAETEDDARKSLLQITSSYGKITKKGLEHFTTTIPQYHSAPCVMKFRVPKVQTPPSPPSDTVVMRIRVQKDQRGQVEEILNSCPFIEVL